MAAHAESAVRINASRLRRSGYSVGHGHTFTTPTATLQSKRTSSSPTPTIRCISLRTGPARTSWTAWQLRAR
jgi:hypothetical protein